jgi:hypothetical protein
MDGPFVKLARLCMVKKMFRYPNNLGFFEKQKSPESQNGGKNPEKMKN